MYCYAQQTDKQKPFLFLLFDDTIKKNTESMLQFFSFFMKKGVLVSVDFISSFHFF
jgi:hypothetical protein